MKQYQSSVIGHIGYDDETERLQIEFQTGAIYEYAGVPWWMVGQLLQAPSRTRFFNESIPNVYFYQKITEPAAA